MKIGRAVHLCAAMKQRLSDASQQAARACTCRERTTRAHDHLRALVLSSSRICPALVRLASGMASPDGDEDFCPFDALPVLLLRVIMLALPVDPRARAACVCRGWRAFLADPSLWRVLDLTPAGGVVAERVTENLVRGAVARAGGQRACPALLLSRSAARYLRVTR